MAETKTGTVSRRAVRASQFFKAGCLLGWQLYGHARKTPAIQRRQYNCHPNVYNCHPNAVGSAAVPAKTGMVPGRASF